MEVLIELDPKASPEVLEGIPKDDGGRRIVYLEWTAPQSLKELGWPEERFAAITRVTVIEESNFLREEVGEGRIGSAQVNVTSLEVRASCNVDSSMDCYLAYTTALGTVRDVLRRQVRLTNEFSFPQPQPASDGRDNGRNGRTRRGSRGSRSSSPPRPHNRARGEE